MRNKSVPNAMRYILVSVALLLVAKFVFLPNNDGDVSSKIAQSSTNISGSDDIERTIDGPTLKVEDYLAAKKQEPFPLEESVVVYGGQDYLEVGSAISVSHFESEIYTASGEEKLVGEYVDENETYHPLEADSIQINHGEFIDVDSFVISEITDSSAESLDRGPFIEVNSLDESLGEQIEVGDDISIGEFIPLPR